MNSDLYKFKSTVCALEKSRCVLWIEVNVTKEIGSFIKIKTMEYSHWVLRKIEC
jgi:hypothetical protein